MQNKKEAFLIYKSFYEPIKHLKNEELGQLFHAIFEFQNYLDNPNNPVGFLDTQQEISKKLPPQIQMAFAFFANQFKLDSEKYQKVIDRNKSNGSKGGRPKTQNKKNNPNNPLGFEKPKKPDKDNDNVNVIISSKNKSLEEIATPVFVKKETWQSFVRMRQKIKKPLTDEAANLILKKLETFENKRAGWANLALENSIESGWQGIFEPREDQRKTEKKSSYNDFHTNDYSAPEGFET